MVKILLENIDRILENVNMLINKCPGKPYMCEEYEPCLSLRSITIGDRLTHLLI